MQTIGPVSLTVFRVEGSGFCTYEGAAHTTVEICNGIALQVVGVDMYATIYYSSGSWQCGFYMKYDLGVGSCSWYAGGFNNALIAKLSTAATPGGTCPPTKTYAMAGGSCPGGDSLPDYTEGDLIVS